MGRRLGLLMSLLAVMVLFPFCRADAETFSRADAEELAKKGAALIQKVGIEEARKTLHDPNGGYLKGNKELYVLVMNFKGEWVVYPPFPETEGKSALNVKDVDGKLLVQDMISVAKEKGEGWVKYRWVHPPSGKIRPKETFVIRIPDTEMFSAVGIYPEQ